LKITAAGKTDPGMVRSNNEDNFFLDEKLKLLVVADGMGGHASGETASLMTVNIMRDYFQGQQQIFGDYDRNYSEATNKLCSAIRLANLAVYEAGQSSPQLKGMGTTVVAAMLTGNKLSIAHIGDSRLYLVRAGNIDQITDDHSIIGEQVRKELITKEEAAVSEIKNVLTRALGIMEDNDPDLDELTVFAGDTLLLCTDGLSNMVAEETMLDIVTGAENNAAACEMLVQTANENGGKDNITVVIGKINKNKWYFSLIKFMQSLRR